MWKGNGVEGKMLWNECGMRRVWKGRSNNVEEECCGRIL